MEDVQEFSRYLENREQEQTADDDNVAENSYVCRILGMELGPMPFVDVVTLINNDELGVRDRIQTGSNGDWIRLGNIPEFLSHLVDRKKKRDSARPSSPSPSPFESSTSEIEDGPQHEVRGEEIIETASHQSAHELSISDLPADDLPVDKLPIDELLPPPAAAHARIVYFVDCHPSRPQKKTRK